MKDFIKWLGVNEKVAKAVVWLLIIMVLLIVTNTMLESIGFPNYQITYDNLRAIKSNIVLEYLISWIIAILNFYTITFLVFGVKEYKKLFKHSLLYLLANIIMTSIFNYGIAQIFIIIYFLIFSYYYSNKKIKYVLCMIISLIINILIQGVAYYYKARLITYESLNRLTQSVLSMDYFIIMGMIILVKEIYLKKRGEKNGK